MNIGEKLKELRNEKNFTQPELAKMLNVSNAAISFWETNKNEPKASYLKELALIFNVTCDYLLGIEDDFGKSKIKEEIKIPFSKNVKVSETETKIIIEIEK